MLVDRIEILAKEYLSQHLQDNDNGEFFLQRVAQLAIERGYLFNREGHPPAQLQRIFSNRERTELLKIYSNKNFNKKAEKDKKLIEDDQQNIPALGNPGAIEQVREPSLFIFGVLFIATLIILAIFFPEPSPFQHLVFRIVLALAAAGIAASLPGLLEVKVAASIKAGGAIAVFIVIYFFSPAQLVTKPPEEIKGTQELIK